MASFHPGGSTAQYLNVSDNAALTLPTTGWTVFAMVYVDSSLPINTNAYIYSHGVAGAPGSETALSILKTNGNLRVIVNEVTIERFDFETTNGFNIDGWNSLACIWDGVDTFKSVLNGIATTRTGTLATLNPSGDLRIGHARFGGSRVWNGRICHVAKFDRAFSTADAQQFTSIFISPTFAQTDKIWHIALWNATNTFDEQQILTMNQVSLTFGDHAPVIYPAGISTSFDDIAAVVARRRVMYVGA